MSLTVKVARSKRGNRAMPGIGDPGLFGALGSIVGKVAGVVRNIPGPIGWGAGAAQKLLSPQQRSQGIPGLPPVPWAGLPQIPKPGLEGTMERLLPFGETGMIDAPTVGAPSGYHVNKTAYWRHDEAGEWQFIPAESRWVKNRRRNPLNPRAASKAIGRLESLKKATARFSRITIRKKCCK